VKTLFVTCAAVAVATMLVVALVQFEVTSRWFGTNKDSLGGIASLATTVGLLGTLAAVVLGVWQLSAQRRQSLAMSMYGAMKDVRDLLKGMRSGSEPQTSTSVSLPAIRNSRRSSNSMLRCISCACTVYSIRPSGTTSAGT
jgi:hypothetical protein